MSLAIRSAKQPYMGRPMGDPGLFSFLGGVAKTVAKGVGGFLTGGIPGAIGAVTNQPRAAIPGASTAGSTPPIMPVSVAGQAMPGTGIQVQFPTLPVIGGGGGGVAIGRFTGGAAGGTPVAVAPNGKVCELKGFHLNKSAYYRHRSRVFGVDAELVQPGQVCVRNRRMNPLNPRALSRAMTRIASAKRAASFLGRVTIRKRKGCGCR